MWDYLKFKVGNFDFSADRDFTLLMLEYAGIALAAFLILFAIAIFYTVVFWRLFEKLGYRGWLGLVPFVNLFLLFASLGIKRYYLPTLFLLAASLVFDMLYIGAGTISAELVAVSIPVALALVWIAFKLSHALAKSFGKGLGYTVSIFFLPMIFIPTLALSLGSFYCKTN